MAKSSSLATQRALWARRLSASACLSLTDPDFARYMDTLASPGGLRAEFRLPKKTGIASSSASSTGRYLSSFFLFSPLNSLSLTLFFITADATSTAPTSAEDEEADACVYLCGNSLGLQPRRTAEMVLEELDVWAER